MICPPFYLYGEFGTFLIYFLPTGLYHKFYENQVFLGIFLKFDVMSLLHKTRSVFLCNIIHNILIFIMEIESVMCYNFNKSENSERMCEVCLIFSQK